MGEGRHENSRLMQSPWRDATLVIGLRNPLSSSKWNHDPSKWRINCVPSCDLRERHLPANNLKLSENNRD